jgi:hypothetical protein
MPKPSRRTSANKHNAQACTGPRAVVRQAASSASAVVVVAANTSKCLFACGKIP